MSNGERILRIVDRGYRTPYEIIRRSGLKPGVVYNTIKRLKDAGRLALSDDELRVVSSKCLLAEYWK